MFTTINRSGRRLVLVAAGLAAAVAATPAPAHAQDTQPATTAPAVRKDLPEAKKIVERSIEAMGGRKALEEIKTRHTKVTMNTPMGEMKLETFVADKDRLLIKQTMPGGMGEGAMGSDGKVAWANNPMMGGYQLLDMESVRAGSGQADILSMALDAYKSIETMSTVDRLEFDGRDCFKVHIVDNAGMEEDRYFDAETGLMCGMSQSRETQMGPMEIVIRLQDWKEVGKVKVFSRLLTSQMGMELEMKVTEVEFNTVEDSVFDLPEEVKAMLEDEPATQPAATKPAGGAGG